jgi:hypothetical protein
MLNAMKTNEWRYNSIIHNLGSSWKWSASRYGRTTPWEIASGTYWIGGRADPRNGLHAMPGIEPGPSKPQLYRLSYS